MIPLHSLSRPGQWTSWHLLRTTSRGSPDRIARLALRTKSTVALDALALGATSGMMNHQEVQEAVLSGHVPRQSLSGDAVRYSAFFALALSAMGRDTRDLTAGTELYWALWHAEGTNLSLIHRWAMAQGLFLSGRHGDLRTILADLRLHDDARRDLETDLTNPYLSPGMNAISVESPEHRHWEKLLSQPFVDAGLSELRVAPDGQLSEHSPLFNYLTASGAPSTHSGGPLVTVVMPCYQPDEGLFTSLASIAAQSWKALEIIVVDDGSGAEFTGTFDRAAALDPRVHLLRMAANGGSYLARNAAIESARGSFITFQDADDWSHPERIARQVAALLEAPQVPANVSLAMRAREDLTHQWFGYPSMRDNASSLMLRKETVDEVGPFLPVRKGADTEYAERVSTLLGPVASIQAPLAVTRLRAGSLSRGDFTYQWQTPERGQFRGTYRAWHRSLQSSEAARASIGDTAPFPVPQSFVRGLSAASDAPGRLDLIYLDDFSRSSAAGPLDEEGPSPQQPSGFPHIGLWHLERPERTGVKRVDMHGTWFDAVIASPHLRSVSRTESLHAARLVVRDPRVLQTAGDQPCAITVDEVEIRLRPEHLRSTALSPGIDLLAIADVCRRWWGRRPVWRTAPDLDPAARAELEDALPRLVTG